MSGGKNVGSFVRLSMTKSDAIAVPRFGCTVSEPVVAPAIVFTLLICVFDAMNASGMTLADDATSVVAVASTSSVELAAVRNRFVRKSGPWNAPENVTGNRGPAAV